MFANDDPTSLAVRPAAAPVLNPGYFTRGNPGLGLPATVVTDDFLNTVMDEILNVVGAAGLAPNKFNNTQLLAAMRSLVGPGRLLGFRVWRVAGTYGYVPTPGTNTLLIDLCGGGASGGGAAPTGASQIAAGSGGGGGGAARRLLSVAAAGATIVVGAGGPAQAAGAPGAAGGSSSFSGNVSATGGSGGTLGSAQASTYVNAVGAAAGGLGFNGDENLVGGFGNYAIYSTNPTSGAGGPSPFSPGAAYVSGNSAGNPGTGPGSGGSGGSVAGSAASGAAGGAGHDGIVTALEFS